MGNGTHCNNPKASLFNDIEFVHFQVDEQGLQVKASTLANFEFAPGDEVTLMLRNGELVLTRNPLKRALLKCAEELQLRQDELKEDFSAGIAALVNAV